MITSLKVYRVDREGDRVPGIEETEEISRIGAELISVDSDGEDATITKAAAADAIFTTGARITAVKATAAATPGTASDAMANRLRQKSRNSM